MRVIAVVIIDHHLLAPGQKRRSAVNFHQDDAYHCPLHLRLTQTRGQWILFAPIEACVPDQRTTYNHNATNETSHQIRNHNTGIFLAERQTSRNPCPRRKTTPAQRRDAKRASGGYQWGGRNRMGYNERTNQRQRYAEWAMEGIGPFHWHWGEQRLQKCCNGNRTRSVSCNLFTSSLGTRGFAKVSGCEGIGF